MLIQGKNPNPVVQQQLEPIKVPDSPKTQKISVKWQSVAQDSVRQSQNNKKEGLLLRDFHRDSNCNCPAVTHQLLIEPTGTNVAIQDRKNMQELYLQHHTNLLNKLEDKRKLNIAGYSITYDQERKEIMKKNHKKLKAKSQPKKFSNVIAHLNLTDISKSVNSPVANELKSVNIMKKVKALTPQNAVLSHAFRTSYRRKDIDSLPSKIAPICKNRNEKGLSSEIQSYIQRMNERRMSKDAVDKDQAHIIQLRERLNQRRYPAQLTANSVDHVVKNTVIPSLQDQQSLFDTSSKGLQTSSRDSVLNSPSAWNSKEQSRIQMDDLVQAVRVTEYPRYTSPQNCVNRKFKQRQSSNDQKVAVLSKKQVTNISHKYVSQATVGATENDSNEDFKDSINNSKSGSGSLMNINPPGSAKEITVVASIQINQEEVGKIPEKDGDSVWTQISPKTPFLSVKVDYQKNKRNSSLGSEFEEETYDQYYVHNALPSYRDKRKPETIKSNCQSQQLDETDIIKRKEMQVVEGQGLVRPVVLKCSKLATGPTHKRTSRDHSRLSNKIDGSVSRDSRDGTPDLKPDIPCDQELISQDDLTAVKYIRPSKGLPIQTAPYQGGLPTSRQLYLKKLVFNIGRNAKLVQGKRQHETAIQTGQPLLIECKERTLRTMTADKRVASANGNSPRKEESPRNRRISPRTARQPERKFKTNRQSFDKDFMTKFMHQNLDIRDVTTPPNQAPKIFKLPKGLHQIEQNAYMSLQNQALEMNLQNAATTPLATHSSLSGAYQTQQSALQKHIAGRISTKDHIVIDRNDDELGPISNVLLSKSRQDHTVSNFNPHKIKDELNSLRNSAMNDLILKNDPLTVPSIMETRPVLVSPFNNKRNFQPYKPNRVSPVRESLFSDSLNQSRIEQAQNQQSSLPSPDNKNKIKASPRKLPRVSPIKKPESSVLNNAQFMVIPTELPSVKGSCIQGSQRIESLQKSKKNAQVVFSSIEKKIYSHVEPDKAKKEPPTRNLVSNSKKRDKGNGDDIQTEQDGDDSSGNMDEDLYLNTSSGEYLTQNTQKLKASLLVQKKINHPNPNVGHKGLQAQKAHTSYMKSRAQKGQESAQPIKRGQEPWKQVKLSVMEFW